MWKSIMCSPRTAEPALLVLLDVLGSWHEHSTGTSDGDKTGVFVLAVSFCNWPLLAPRPPLQQLSILLPPLHLPASGAGLKPGPGAATGAPGPVLPLRLFGPLPAVLGPCHTDTSALSAVSGPLSFAGNCGDVEHPPGALCPTYGDGVFPPPLCASALPSALQHSGYARGGGYLLEGMPRAIRPCHQPQQVLHASPPVPATSLGRSQCSQRDLGFALHAGLQCRPSSPCSAECSTRMWWWPWNAAVAGTRCCVLTPSTMPWVCWHGETPFSPLPLTFVLCAQGAPHSPHGHGPEGLVTQGQPSRLEKAGRGGCPQGAASKIVQGPLQDAGQRPDLCESVLAEVCPHGPQSWLLLLLLPGRCPVSPSPCVPGSLATCCGCSAHRSHAGSCPPWRSLWR
ncbi:uncharacterized protein LOC119696496 isoform X1 [Motacilla alba alba]|uniref:uncharacterized protein LOC119696496 isoform X1 n=1 Tax=Motacilla alba alba TaxID=1094192 RepID=UPI0018D55988|nr:uncharacterized protein LOC119696496 isoform X1 [Motacilla alba alba]